MKVEFLSVLALAGIVVGIPLAEDKTLGSLDKRAVSPDASCGGNLQYTCQGSTFGQCCSKFGFWYVAPGLHRSVVVVSDT